MAPPRKPTELKRRQGTLRPDRLPAGAIRAEVVALPARSAVPEHLGPAGAAMWRLVLGACEGWLGQGDQAVVLLLAEGADERAAIRERLERDGEVLYTDKGYAYQHPLLGRLGHLESQMTRWISALGLAPADRARLGLVEVRRVSKLEELRSRRAGG